jgi:hypothetical protein
MTLLSFELEVAVDSDIKGIEESVATLEISKDFEISLTAISRRSPIHLEGFFGDEGMPDIQPSTLRSTSHQCRLDHDPDRLVSEPLNFSTF